MASYARRRTETRKSQSRDEFTDLNSREFRDACDKFLRDRGLPINHTEEYAMRQAAKKGKTPTPDGNDQGVGVSSMVEGQETPPPDGNDQVN